MIKVKQFSSFADLAFFEKEPVPFFQSLQCLQVFAKNFSAEQNSVILGVFDFDKLIGYGAFEKTDGKIVFLGMKKVLNGQEVTDYGDIFLSKNLLQVTDDQSLTNQAWQAILNWFKENGFNDVELDYVKEDSQTYQFFSNIGVNLAPQEVAPYIMLPKTWEDYVSQLEYHNRHELRRKIKRLEKSSFAPPAGGTTEGQEFYKFVSINSQEQNMQDLEKYFAEFIRLVKLAEDEKKQFMTNEMEKFFWDLIPYSILNFLEIESKPVAAILTFENGIESLAYNSGYDPAFKFYSAGLLIHAFKIKDLIENKYKKYDFLRGNERYKYDLGGIDMRLYNITINL